MPITELLKKLTTSSVMRQKVNYCYYMSVCTIVYYNINNYAGTKIVGAKSLEEMVAKLKKPRRVMMLVKAGSAVDSFIDQLVPLLEKGDIIIDGGNSEYTDTIVCIYFNILYKSCGLLFFSAAASHWQRKVSCL